jgi:hypothetical protein
MLMCNEYHLASEKYISNPHLEPQSGIAYPTFAQHTMDTYA